MNENEKVIHDIKISETEDGFRIEIKGDKEFLRHWIDRAGAFFTRFGEDRGHGPFRGRGPFGPHHGPFGHEHGPFGDHGPFGPDEREPQHQHFGGFGPFGGRGPFGRPGPDPEAREALRQQAREWHEQAHEFKRQMRDWQHQIRDMRRQAWNMSPEEREAFAQQAQAWREQWPFGQGEKPKRDEQTARGPFDWRGHREKPKRYDLGPWWDEGDSATDELPTV